MLAEPVSAVLLAAILLGQALTLPIIGGVIAIVFGAALVARTTGEVGGPQMSRTGYLGDPGSVQGQFLDIPTPKPTCSQ